MPVHDGPEDALHGVVVKLVDGDGVEVAQEAGSDWVTAAAGRTHGRDQLNVNQLHGRGLLQVVPATREGVGG